MVRMKPVFSSPTGVLADDAGAACCSFFNVPKSSNLRAFDHELGG